MEINAGSAREALNPGQAGQHTGWLSPSDAGFQGKCTQFGLRLSSLCPNSLQIIDAVGFEQVIFFILVKGSPGDTIMYDVYIFLVLCVSFNQKSFLSSPDALGDHLYYSQHCATLLFRLSSFMCRLECTCKHQAQLTRLGTSELR